MQDSGRRYNCRAQRRGSPDALNSHESPQYSWRCTAGACVRRESNGHGMATLPVRSGAPLPLLHVPARSAMASLAAELGAASLRDDDDGGGAEAGGWDDSALVTAYEDAVRRYQRAHGLLPPGACFAGRGCAPPAR